MHGTTLKSINNCCILPTSFNSYYMEKQGYGRQVNYTLEIMEPHWSVYLWYIQVPHNEAGNEANDIQWTLTPGGPGLGYATASKSNGIVYNNSITVITTVVTCNMY